MSKRDKLLLKISFVLVAPIVIALGVIKFMFESFKSFDASLDWENDDEGI